MPKKPKILVFESNAELAKAAAVIFRDSCKAAVARRGLFSVALSGGKTPAALYAALAAPPFRDAVRWRETHLFWGDERCCPPDDKESNFHTAFVNLISKIDIPDDNVHRIQGEVCQVEPVTAAALYEEELLSFFKSERPAFDLVLLGLGADGHTLSVFPGSARPNPGKLVTIGKDQLGLWRISLTIEAVSSSAKAIFLVSGKEKAAILKDVLDGKKGLPAAEVDLANGELIWLADKEAAGLI